MGEEINTMVQISYSRDTVAYFVYRLNNSAVAKRHQGISMFGETNAFNLNSHVYNDDADGIYLSVRYSNTKKAAADMPNVVGSMFANGLYYLLVAVGGAAIGAGLTLALQKKKRKEETVLDSTKE